MKIVSANKESAILLVINKQEMDNYPSLNLVIEVKDGAFSGAIVTWLALSDFNRFLLQLKQCEQTRQGQAALISMSPDEFKLQIQNIDRSGHFVALYQLTCLSYMQASTIVQTLSGGFMLDSEFFIQLISDFEELINPTLLS